MKLTDLCHKNPPPFVGASGASMVHRVQRILF